LKEKTGFLFKPSGYFSKQSRGAITRFQARLTHVPAASLGTVLKRWLMICFLKNAINFIIF